MRVGFGWRTFCFRFYFKEGDPMKKTLLFVFLFALIALCSCGQRISETTDNVTKKPAFSEKSENVTDNAESPKSEQVTEAVTDIPTTPDEYFKFTLLDDGTYAIRARQNAILPDNVIIPSTHDGKPVTTIEKEGFSQLRDIENVVIPDSITNIGPGAFSGCSSLERITLPFIGESKTKKSKTENMFLGLGYIFGGNTYEDNSKFVPSSLKSVILSDTCETIPDYSFHDCSSLRSITIPDGVTSIGFFAFRNCNCLTSIAIPDSVTSIGGGIFTGCSNLENVTVSEENTKYHSASNCLIETESKTLIAGCKSSIIPDDGSVTSIDGYAFVVFDSLTSITIPSCITSIGGGIFMGCSNLENVTVSEENTKYHSSGNCLIETESKTLIVGCKNSIIPDDGSVTSIGACAFDGRSSLTSITIPDSVTSIGHAAFYYCSSLKSVTIGNGVTSIGNQAFQDCSSLKNITIPDSVTSIGSDAFKGCSSLKSVTIGNGVTSIGSWAFQDCSSLTSITIPDSVTSIGAAAFSDCIRLTTVYYTGTEEQWAAISILLNAANIVYNYEP